LPNSSRLDPTPRQAEIRDHTPLGLVVTAPAGCGKTEALALRVRGFLDRGVVVPPRKILMLTFTNRSRENIEGRLQEHLTLSEVSRYITVHNLHGFSARIVEAHGNTIGLDEKWEISKTDWVSERLRDNGLPTKTRNRIKRHLKVSKLETRTDVEVLEHLERHGHRIAYELERERQQNMIITYDDLPRLADLILKNDDVADLYRQHFACVIVDEFQDLTLQQLSIIQRIGRERTTYAGDLAQGIYGFAGAAPERVLHAALAEGIAAITFAESHRSSPAVLDLVNSLIPWTLGDKLECSVPASWPGGGLAAHRVASDVAEEANWVMEFASTLLDLAPSHRIGVLARSKMRREAVDAKLTERRNTFDWYRWDDPIFDSRIALYLKSSLRKISNQQLSGPEFEEHVRANIDPLELQDPITKQGLVEACGWVRDLSAQGVSKVDIIDRIKIGENDTVLTAAGLHLVTGHSGKGQQFDWVIVLGVESDSIPSRHAKTQDELVEEARVLSVMISRARHGVITTQVRTIDLPWRSNIKVQPSRFQEALNSSPSYRDWESARQWLNARNWEDIESR